MKPLEPRRRRAVILATLPATFLGAMTPLTMHVRNKPYGPALIVGVVILMSVPLGFAMRDIALLRREGGCERS